MDDGQRVKDVVLAIVLIADVLLAIVLIADVVFATMVLIADMLMVLICPPLTCWRLKCCS